MDKILFKNNEEPAINAENLNLLQDNVDTAMIKQTTGEWVPELADVSSETSKPTVTYNSRSGNYTRIGNLVIATFNMTGKITALTTTNYAAISGLPFALSKSWDGFGSMYRAYNLTSSNGFPAPFVVNQLSGSDKKAIIQLQNSEQIGGVCNFKLSGSGTFECTGGVIYSCED